MAGEKSSSRLERTLVVFRGDMCLSGVTVISDAPCEDVVVTLRVSVYRRHVYLSTKTVKGGFICFTVCGTCSINQPVTKMIKHKTNHILIDGEMKAQER